MDGGGWIEIIFLAMLAGFIGLRLYNVLGRRTGAEKPVADPFRPAGAEVARASSPIDRDAAAAIELPAGIEPDLRPGIEAVMRADRTFTPDGFAKGAEAAYAMILEAFWKGDAGALGGLVDDDVQDEFRTAIDARRATGERVENRLVRIDGSRIVAARMSGTMAEVTVRFDAAVIIVSRDDAGRLIAGDETTPVETHDLWTFSRLTSSGDPNWLLIATDDEV